MHPCYISIFFIFYFRCCVLARKERDTFARLYFSYDIFCAAGLFALLGPTTWARKIRVRTESRFLDFLPNHDYFWPKVLQSFPHQRAKRGEEPSRQVRGITHKHTFDVIISYTVCVVCLVVGVHVCIMCVCVCVYITYIYICIHTYHIHYTHI